MSYVHKSSNLTLRANLNLDTGLTKALLVEAEPCRDGASPLVVDVKVTSGTGTIYLQDSSDGFVTANDKKSVVVTGAGTFSITLLPHLAGDQSYYPLRSSLRLVMTTTSAVVIENIRLMVEQ